MRGHDHCIGSSTGLVSADYLLCPDRSDRKDTSARLSARSRQERLREALAGIEKALPGVVRAQMPGDRYDGSRWPPEPEGG